MKKASPKNLLLVVSIIVLAATGLVGCEKNPGDTTFYPLTTATEFIDYTVNGTPYSHVYAVDSILHIIANNGPTLYDLASGYNPNTNLNTSFIIFA